MLVCEVVKRTQKLSQSSVLLIRSIRTKRLGGANGIYTAEQRLRYLLGMPAGDGRLIKPTSRPIQAQIVYDWNGAIGDALTQRVEVRRQKWSIKRRELELIAARQNRRPRLDALTQYRWRGLGTT